MKRILFLFIANIYFFSGHGQEVSLRIGTEFPLQHYFGINYQHNSLISADLSYGIVDSPYNNELYDWIRVPSDRRPHKDFLQGTTDDGWVLGFGVNVHKNKWYFGLHCQLIRLNASGTYNDIINSDLVQNELASDEKALLDSVLLILRNPFTSFIVNLNDKVSIETSLFQLGVKVGRKFQFKNPKWSMNAELGITANMYANTKTTYNEELIPIIESFAQNQVTGSNQRKLQENLNFVKQGDEISEFFRDYGYIPGLRIGISYLLYKK